MPHKRKKFVSYYDKLKDRRWQKRRLEILQRDNFCCQYPNCESQTSMLDVHHKAYLRNTNPWDYPEYCLVTFCQEHHEIEQERMQQAHLAIASNPALIRYCIDHAIENVNINPRFYTPEVIRQKTDAEKFEASKILFKQMREAVAKPLL